MQSLITANSITMPMANSEPIDIPTLTPDDIKAFAEYIELLMKIEKENNLRQQGVEDTERL